jgi:uncharacterized protein
MSDFRSRMPRGAGGTPGGLVEFFVGVGMMLVGAWLFFSNLVVTSTFGALWGRGGSGVWLLVVLIGIGLVFFSGKSWLGWVMIVGGLIAIMITVITNLTIYFQPNSFLSTLIMLGLIFGGLGLVARSVRSVTS